MCKTYAGGGGIDSRGLLWPLRQVFVAHYAMVTQLDGFSLSVAHRYIVNGFIKNKGAEDFQ